MLKQVIVKQQDQKDCGICCIQSILKYYDGYVPLEKIREDSFTSKRGTSAFHIIEVLKKYGFDAFGTKIKKENLRKEKFPLPAIIHVVLDNGLNHYMVLYEIRKEKVVLMDPSEGKKTMSYSDFFWIWSEVAIILHPKEKILCYPKEKGIFLLLLQFLGKHKKNFYTLICTQVILTILILMNTFFLKIELYYLNQKNEQIIFFLFFLFLFWLRLIGKKAQLREEHQLNRNLELLHLSSYLEHLQRLPLNIIKGRELGDYLLRTWEQQDIKYLYTDVLKNSLISLGIAIGGFFFLFFLNKTFFTFYGIISIIYFTIHIIFQKRSDYYEKKTIESQNYFSNQILNNFENIETYTYLNIKDKANVKMERNYIQFLKDKDSKNEFYKKYNLIQNWLKESSDFVLVFIGIILMEQKVISVVDYFINVEIGGYLLSAIETLLTLSPKMRYFTHLIKKSNSFLSIDSEEDKGLTEFQKGDIEIDNLTYSYNQYQYVLKDLKLNMKENSHVLLSGASGSGKSTFCKILTGILKPSYGTIKINNINIEDYQKTTLRSHITYLPQHGKLINGTIKENIIMDRPIDQTKFLQICETCEIYKIIEKKPLRFETPITNQENNLSGGEKQRILLARSLLSEADIFLLDEALSEVDEKLEKTIIKKLQNVLKEKTLIYISHKNHKKLFDVTIKLESVNERVFIPK